MSHMKRWKNWSRYVLGTALLASSVGCSRTFWRQQADVDSYTAITEHLTNERWALPRIDIDPDPRSRFYDPYDPDCEPLPPDDPAAHVYMHWVDGWEGYKCWHKFGDLMTVENPQWLAQFGQTVEMIDPETGEYIAPVPKIEDMTLTQSVELAQIQNRDYQTQLENLFLTALTVTFERYQLGIRYLEPNGVITQSLDNGGGFGRFGVNSIGISQSLPWGTQLATELANTTIWSFGNGSQTSSISTLSFSILQPLFNGAGRKVNLEALTQSERDLLYQARDLARFRKILFSDIVSQYLSLAQSIQSIRNEQGNIVRLTKQVETLLATSDSSDIQIRVEIGDLGPENEFVVPDELKGKLTYRLGRFFWRGTMSAEEEQILRNLVPGEGFQLKIDDLVNRLPTPSSPLDVLQLQFDLTNSINNLRSLERSYQDGLDSFKIFLGLPPDIEITLDESLLSPFEVIDDRLTDQENAVEEFVDVLFEELELNTAEGQAIPLEDLKEAATALSNLIDESMQNVLETVRQDMQTLDERIDDRLAAAETPELRSRLQSDYAKSKEDFRNSESNFQAIRQLMDRLLATLNSNPAEDVLVTVPAELNKIRQELLTVIQAAAVPQVSARVELINVAPFDLSLQQATQLAVENRLDLMNARAEVMDARRRVEVVANALRGVLDVGIDGSISTDPGGKDPFDFRDDTGVLSASLAFDTPLDQIDERNAYRRVLVAYQRARRDYMLAEDLVKEDVRRAWRQLRVLRQNLETSRVGLRIAALQYDSAIAELSEPRDPRAAVNRSSGLQGQNLTRALNSILSAQNQLIRNWVNYEQNRINIYRDMGIMEIGPDGIWNDEVYRNIDNTFRENQNGFENRQNNALDTTWSDPGGSGGLGFGGQNPQTGVVQLPPLDVVE
ncbi:TolC family protein [Thalassoglobus sp. JC818]|uniref:TolC family protein n=1 Tax=Thalassoglobus sp. JC818 TaxID=3232136 RepID=UPI00345A9131